VSEIAQAHELGPRPLRLPNVSYGPFKLLEAVPWLMLATSLRFLAGSPFAMVTMHSLSGICIFLAFLLAARRMIEFSGGHAPFSRLDFDEQLLLARAVLWQVVALILAASALGFATVSMLTGWSLLWGLDGIAFDPLDNVEMIWSSLLAAIILLMIVNAQESRQASGLVSGRVSLIGALRELAARSFHMVPGLIAVAVIHFTLSAVQGVIRNAVFLFMDTSPSPDIVKSLVYFVFVFGFASVRLWATLAALIFALRRSYWARSAHQQAPIH